jgi:hypothetical protein
MADANSPAPAAHATLLSRIEALPGELWTLAVNKGYSPEAADQIKTLVSDGAQGVKDAADTVVALAEPALLTSEAVWPAFLKPFAPLIIPFVDNLLEQERDTLKAKAAAEAQALEDKISAWGQAKAAAPTS